MLICRTTPRSHDAQPRASPSTCKPLAGVQSVRRHGWIHLGLLVVAGLGSPGCVVIHPSGTCGPSCDDIADAATIALSSQRLDVVNAICARRFLSQHEQYYAVNAVVGGRAGGAQSGPLITLIENPCCTPETRRYISDRLPLITFSRERRRVAEMLSQTDTANPPPGPLPPDERATPED